MTRTFLRARYEGEVRFTDDQLKEVFKELKDQGLYDKSLIVLTSDHGEEFWEHNKFGHGHSYHNEVINVPLIIKYPGNKHAGKNIKIPVSTKQIGKTIMDISGIKNTFPGQSLKGCIEYGTCLIKEESGFWFSESAMAEGDLGSIGHVNGSKVILKSDGSIVCYDIFADPLEQTPLSEEFCTWPNDTGKPKEVFSKFIKNNHKIFKGLGGDKEEFSGSTDNELKRLKALGYL